MESMTSVQLARFVEQVTVKSRHIAARNASVTRLWVIEDGRVRRPGDGEVLIGIINHQKSYVEVTARASSRRV